MASNTLFKFFSGTDVFVSYRWGDINKQYALNLTKQLEKRGLTSYIDAKGLARGEIVPTSLRNAIRKSKMFVLIATDDLRDSTWVPKELALAKEFNRKIVPLNVGHALEGLDPDDERWLALKDRSRIEEKTEVHRAGVPSDHVAEQIDQAYTFTRRRVSAIRWLFVVGLVFFAVSVFAISAAGYAVAVKRDAEATTLNLNQQAEKLRTDIAKAREDKEAAELATKLAQQGKTDAETARGVALREKASAQTEAGKAREERQKAQADAARAKRDKDLADTAREQALKDKEQAVKDAAEQTRIAAEKTKLAEKAGQERKQALGDALDSGASRIHDSLNDLDRLQPAVTDALQNYTKWNPEELDVPERLHVALADAFVNTKRQGLALGVGEFPQVKDFDISPQGNLMVQVGFPLPEDAHEERPAATLWDVRTREMIWRLSTTDSKITACAISPDSDTLAIGFENGELKFLDIKGVNVTENRSLRFTSTIASLKFTATGKRLVVWTSHEWNGKNIFIVDPHGSIPAPVSFPEDLHKLELGNAYRYYSGMFQQGTFSRVHQVPLFIGAFDFKSQLTTVNTDTGDVAHFDLSTKRVEQYTGDFNGVRASVLSPDGRWLLGVPSTGEQLRLQTTPFVIDLRCVAQPKSKCPPGQLLAPIYYHSRPQIAFDPSGKFLLIGEEDRKLRVYEIETILASPNAPPREIEFPGRFTIKGFTADGKRVIVLVNNTKDAQPGELQSCSLDFKSSTERYSLDQSELFWDGLDLKQAAGGAFQVGLTGGTIHIWEQNSTPGFSFIYDKSSLGIDMGSASDATVAPDAKLVATAHPNGYVALWRLPDRTLAGVIRGLNGPGVSIEWGGLPGNHALYVASGAGQLFKWTPDGTLVNLQVPQSIKTITELHVSRGGLVAAVWGADGPLAILKDGKWTEVNETGRPVAVSEDGRRVAVGQSKGIVEVVNLDTRDVTVLNPVEDILKCTPDRLRFAMADTRVVGEGCNGVTVWDSHASAPLSLATPLERRRELPASVTTKPPDLWLRYIDGDVSVVDLLSGKAIARVRGRVPGYSAGTETRIGGRSTVFGFDESANLAAAGVSDSDAGTLQVWRLNSGEAVSSLPISINSKRVEFLPGGNRLLVISPAGVPVIVSFDAKRQFQALCPLFWSRVDTRRLTPEAYEFCRATFDQITTIAPVAPTVAAWIVSAPARQR